jgi:hypothetical protein
MNNSHEPNEPVAWMDRDGDLYAIEPDKNWCPPHYPLYTTPQPVVPDGDRKCSVCEGDFTEDEGGRRGYIGILSVAFCPTCYAGIADMVDQFDCHEWAVPDEITDRSESPEYIQGFNDCRALMLEMRKP